MKKGFATFIILFAVFCVQTFAQETILRNFPSTLYSGGTQNWDVKQLPDGQMAFANNNGLLIFNGAKWSCNPIRNYSTVRALFYDKASGLLFAGASEEFGYYKVDPLTYQYRYHNISDKLPTAMKGFGEIWKIIPWQGKIVFQSKSHIIIYNRNGKMWAYRSPQRIETVANIGGRLILATRKGLEELSNGKCRMLPGAEFNKMIIARAVLQHGNSILVATQQNGIMIYDGKTLHEDASELAPLLKKCQIFSAEIHDCRLAIGTVRAGLIVTDLNDSRKLYINSSKGLINNTVLSLAFDYDGNIWLGLDNGISCALTNMPYQNIVSERASIGTGYASIVFGNKLYLGTNQGLYMQDMPLMQQLEYSRPTPIREVSGQVWNLCSIGNTLFCCADRGLYSVSGGQAEKIEGPDGVWCLCELKRHPGCIIAADYLGLVLLKRQGPRYVMAHRIKSDIGALGNIYEDTDGTLWSSHWQKGVYHLAMTADMKSVRTLQHFNSRNGLLVDQNNLICKLRGQIYVSSVDGFYKYDRQSRRLVYDKQLSKVFNTYGTSLKITETPTHDLWAQKADYLALAHAKGGRYTVDSISYRGMAATQQFAFGNMSALGNGFTLINSSNGFYLAKNACNISEHKYPLFINRITSTNNGDTIVYQHTHNDLGKRRKITLPHSLNTIEIEFIMPEFDADDAVSYSCYMENYDKRWTVSHSNTKEYTQLGKGVYILHVRAYNRISGYTQETSMEITVLPAWYETVWAYLIYLLLAAYAIYRFMKYLKIRADKELMIEKTRQKAEMAVMKTEKLQAELKHKSSELASSTMSSIHRNDILQKIDEQMATLSEAVRREEKKAALTAQIADIRGDLQHYLDNDEGWEKFVENFNIVYDDFMKILTERYANLKVNDLKLCAYLRMGLNSKDMAALLNMSVRSIETARYRLRKKLNLEAGENLTDFLQNLK